MAPAARSPYWFRILYLFLIAKWCMSEWHFHRNKFISADKKKTRAQFLFVHRERVEPASLLHPTTSDAIPREWLRRWRRAYRIRFAFVSVKFLHSQRHGAVCILSHVLPIFTENRNYKLRSASSFGRRPPPSSSNSHVSRLSMWNGLPSI